MHALKRHVKHLYHRFQGMLQAEDTISLISTLFGEASCPSCFRAPAKLIIPSQMRHPHFCSSLECLLLILIMRNKSMHITYSVSCLQHHVILVLLYKGIRIISKKSSFPNLPHPRSKNKSWQVQANQVLSLPLPEVRLVLDLWCDSGKWPIRENLLVEFWECSLCS